MAKVVRWKGEFSDINATVYTVEIYGESTGVAAKTITLGANPLRTQVDNSNETDKPVRECTGSLEIIDYTGTLIDEIMPTDVTDRPVLVKQGTKVVWQGFLKPEAYTQGYTERVQSVTFPIVDVLGAMDGVYLTYDSRISFATLLKHIAYMIGVFNSEAGLKMIDLIRVDDRWGNGFFRSVFYNLFFKSEEVLTDDVFLYEEKGLSIQESLSIIAEYFGLVLMYEGGCLYFYPFDHNQKKWHYFESTTEQLNEYLNGGSLTRTWGYANEKDIHQLDWFGDKNNKTIVPAVKRVILEAEVGKYEKLIELPKLNMTTIVENSNKTRGDVVVGTQSIYDNNHISLKGSMYQLDVPEPTHPSPAIWIYPDITITNRATYSTNQYAKTIFFGSSSNDYDNGRGRGKSTGSWSVNGPGFDALTCGYAAGQFSIINAAFFAGYAREHTWNAELVRTSKTGLMVMGTPLKFYGRAQDGMVNIKRNAINNIGHSATNYLYKQKSYRKIKVASGWLNVDMNICHFLCSTSNIAGCKNMAKVFDEDKVKMHIAVQLGSKYWNETDKVWQTAFTSFDVDFNESGNISTNKEAKMRVKKNDGFFIPITSDMEGEVSIYIYRDIQGCTITDDNTVTMFDGFILDKVDVTYEPVEPRFSTDGNNTFYREACSRAVDEMDKKVRMTTMYMNDYAPNMLYDSESTPTTTVALGDSLSMSVRPEKDLLERVVEHYSKPRMVIDLQVKPMSTPLAITSVTDGEKRFVPVSEDRDWKLGQSTLKLIETV